jgi:hypothetical protein
MGGSIKAIIDTTQALFVAEQMFRQQSTGYGDQKNA